MSITVDLSDELSAELARCAQHAGQTAERFAADALRRQLAIQSFRDTKERLAPYGESSGLGNDDDALSALS